MDFISVAKAILNEDGEGSVKVKRLAKNVLRKMGDESKQGSNVNYKEVKKLIKSSNEFSMEGKLVRLKNLKRKEIDPVDDSIVETKRVKKLSDDKSGDKNLTKSDVDSLEAVYRKALATFKADKTNKDLRRAKSSAKKAWDAAVAATQEGEQLTCRDCSQKFIFSTKNLQYYNDNPLHKPLRCMQCSIKDNERGGDRTKDSKGKNMCYAFQRGECTRGLYCKFSHDPNHAGGMEVRCLTINNKDS